MRHRLAAALIGAWVLLPTPAAAAAPADLRLTLAIDRNAVDHVRVIATIVNAGTGPAFEPYAELWNLPGRRRFGDLAPAARAEIVWELGADTWAGTVREVAALRVRYRDG